MASDLSVWKIESEFEKMSKTLDSCRWDDRVKDSYGRFIGEEKKLLNRMSASLECANRAFRSADSVEIESLESECREIGSRLESLY